MKQYKHRLVEKKWQKLWKILRVYKIDKKSKLPKFYVLDMFPYPSGEGLHVGHPKGYIATDIVSRMKRMQGYNVLHPMGFDAFGLPAENYALKTKTNPAVAVAKNVKRYKKQLEIIGFDYDWSREINTTDPKFYKWTQWIFLKLLEKGLAYESTEPINWCPSCKTGLANEDVEDGRCERCGTPVEKKPMRQWVLRITKYADRLLQDLDTLDWPESIKESQRNWIGRSEGAEIDFRLRDREEKIRVFTTRPDTLFGVTYVVLAPEHALVADLLKDHSLVKNRDEVIKYVAQAKVATAVERTDATKPKTGIEIKGVAAVNPINGEAVPVWVADYVLADYGTGAVMAVPAHDERDWAFAKAHGLSAKQVIEPTFAKTDGEDAVREGEEFSERTAAICIVKHWSEDKYLCSKWKANDWQGFVTGGIEEGEKEAEASVREVAEETGYTDAAFVRSCGTVHSKFFHKVKGVNRFAHFKVAYIELRSDARTDMAQAEKDLHDVVWVDSNTVRHYINRDDMRAAWDLFSGTLCHTGEGILVDSGKFSGKGSEESKKAMAEAAGGEWVVRYKLKDWVFSRQRYWGEPIPVLHENGKAVPVGYDDLPVKLPKVKSYQPTGTGESPLADISKWVNVRKGFGKKARYFRRETNTMPQWAGSSWYYLRYMDPNNDDTLVDPDKERYWNQVDFYVGGAEHATRHLIYARFWHKFLYDIGAVSTIEPFKRLQSVGLIMGEDGRKMSKRFGNVVNPDDIVETYGADTLRVYEMFMGPFDQAIAWDTKGIAGSRRFLERVWKFRKKVKWSSKKDKAAAASFPKEAEILLHKTIKKVTEDIEGLRHNTAISSLMILSNELDRLEYIPRSAYEAFLKLLAPFAPHMTEELWRRSGNPRSIHLSEWPKADESKIASEDVTIAVQVNGKTRATFKAAKGSAKDDLQSLALSLDEVRKWTGEKAPEKVIVVPDRMVSIVVRG